MKLIRFNVYSWCFCWSFVAALGIFTFRLAELHGQVPPPLWSCDDTIPVSSPGCITAGGSCSPSVGSFTPVNCSGSIRYPASYNDHCRPVQTPCAKITSSECGLGGQIVCGQSVACVMRRSVLNGAVFYECVDLGNSTSHQATDHVTKNCQPTTIICNGT